MRDTRIFCERTRDLDALLSAVDARMLRAAFAELTERALPQMTEAHLDLDDVLLEHVAGFCDTSDGTARTFEIMLATLSDQHQWLHAFDEAREQAGLPRANPATTRMQTLRLRVHQEVTIPLPDFRVP
ncbi:MAG: hypothetical protein H6817_01075 [Phycisphaerales bacterium]|nr:hypothetical protein [Phycisphaerales bacterium]